MNNGTYITNKQANKDSFTAPAKQKESITADQSQSLFFILTFISRYFAFYGMQYLICVKLNIQHFSLLETLVIYLGIISIFTRFNK